MTALAVIDRGFVRIAEGQVHYRAAGPREPTAAPPIVMLHASPASSLTLVPLIGRFARNLGTVIPVLVGAAIGASVNSSEGQNG